MMNAGVESIFSQSLTPAAIISRDMRLIWFNQVFDEIFGATVGQRAGFVPREGFDSELNASLMLMDKMANGLPWRGAASCGEGRQKRHFDLSEIPLPEKQFLLLVNETTQYLRRLSHAVANSNRDRLTGLSNRNYFYEILGSAIKNARRSSARQALLALDLDGFKSINDTHGHEAGDVVLAEVARRMSSSVRDTDSCARIGGDEFAIVLSNLAMSSDACMVSDKIIARIQEPILYKDTRMSVGVSIGIVDIANDRNPQEIILCADKALYVAKAAGKGCWRRG